MQTRVKVVLTLMGALFLFVLVFREVDGIWSLVLFIFLAFLLHVFTDDSPSGSSGRDGGAGYDGGGRGGDGGFGGGGDGGD
ncbi:hypothetical protein AB0C28_06555 [Nonomuraea sp. NPDC048892]|uniref:hypothetical protein n=1 Tax=Nonomuraea sp. NPDC048892 TaxID=3154624 RepID=UPI0033EDF7C5